MFTDIKQKYAEWHRKKAMKQVDKHPYLKLRVVCDDHRVYTKVVDERNPEEERYPVAGHKSNAALFFEGYSDEFDIKKDDINGKQLIRTDYLKTYAEQMALGEAMPQKTTGLDGDTMNYIMLAGIAVIIVMMFGVL